MRPDPLIGSELAGYRIEELIGRGGMGVVYRAEHLLLGRKDAIKLLSPELAEDASFRERFLRESRLAASIDHSNIVPIYHAGEMDGLLFIAMRYVEGTDLRTVLRQERKLDPVRTLSIVDQVAKALDAAHAVNLVHRDVKPGNILLATGDRVYLTDFGIAKHTATHGGLTQTGSFVGTLDYSAPEQIEGKDLDGRADVYSLACVAFQCLSGGTPYEKDSEVQLIYAHLLEPPPAISSRLPELPPGLDAVVARGLAKSKDDRYPTAGELAAALRGELERRATPTRVEPSPRAEPSPAPPPPPLAPPPEPAAPPPAPAAPLPAEPAVRKKGLSPALLVGGVVAAVALAAVAVVALTGGGGGGFPDEGEQRLLSLVPASIREGCGRTLEVVPVALAGVDCRAAKQLVSYYRFDDTGAVRREHVRRANLALPAGFGPDTGACASPPRIGERAYTAAGPRAGRVFCAPGPTAAVIGWTDERANVFAVASRSDGDQAGLYRWWERSAGPLSSPGRKSVEPRSAVVPSGAILYRESFASSSSGWSRPDSPEADYGYAGGRYRIVVKQREALIPVTTANLDPPLTFGSVSLEATVARPGGQRSYGFGLACRSGKGSSLYTLQIRSDGLALIRKRRGTRPPVELETPAKLPRGLLRAGPNRIGATCAGGDGGPVRLTLSLNGQRVLAAEDRRPLAATGAVGVLASSLARGGVVVTFDDFRVRKS